VQRCTKHSDKELLTLDASELMLSLLRCLTRALDTDHYRNFVALPCVPVYTATARTTTDNSRSLRKLALQYLDRTIQTGEHDPAVDATAAMDLYKLKRAEWENSLKELRGGSSGSGSKNKSKKSRNTA
jgi:hypothetical protein